MANVCMSERQRVRFYTTWLLGLTMMTLLQFWSPKCPPGWQNIVLHDVKELSIPALAYNRKQSNTKDVVEVLVDGPLEATDNRLIEWVKMGGGGRMFPPSTLPYNITIDNTGNWRDSDVFKFYVRMIDKYFGLKSGGFFVEAGALDGVLLSPTLRLEQELNWKGLLVEPRPDMFEQLRKKNRRAYAAKFCLSEKQYPHKTSFWMSPDYVKESVAYSAVSSQLFEKVEFHEREIGNVVGVHCMPLVTLLKATGRDHVDLWVLDVEGAEWGVIEHFPFHQVTIDMLAVERKDKGQKDKAAFIQLIQDKGYTLIKDIGEDYIFVRKNATFNMKPSSSLIV